MHPDKALGRTRGATAPQMSDSARSEQLEALGVAIAARRQESMTARKVSGIESTWQQCEEAYLGIDDANRSEWAGAKWAKPTGMQGPLTSSKITNDPTRSSAFVRLTSRYVDSASAKLCEILLPIDDKAFSFAAMPVPLMLVQTPGAQAVGASPAMPMPAAAPVAPPAPGAPVAPPGQPAPAAAPVDPELAIEAQAADSAERAEKRVFNWMVESKYPGEARKVVKDAARVGVGVLMGVIPDVKMSRAISKTPDGKVALQIAKSIVPRVKWIDYDDLFPADGCGEDVHDGEHILVRDKMSRKALSALRDQPGYLTEQINRVLAEGPGKEYVEDANSRKDDKNNKRFEVWYFYGSLTRDEMVSAKAEGIDDLPGEQEDVHAIVTIVNDTVIRATINPSDSGKFPVKVFCWSRRPGQWAGVGVGEQMSMPQRMCNAATRAMLNNAGVSSGVQIIMDELGVVPADGQRVITPNKIWLKTADSMQGSVRDVMAIMELPNVGTQLMGIIEYAMKLAEEATGIPLITQGQTGPTSPETFGQAELQNNNSLTWLRAIANDFDDQITEPVVDDYYEWLLLDPEVPDNEKAEFEINAHGSIAMVERAIQEQTLMGMLGASANPAFNVDPGKLFAEYLKAKRLDPRKIQYSAAEQAARAQQPPPPPIQIAVEQAKGQNALQLQQAKSQAELQLMQQEDQAEQQKLANGQATPHMASASAAIEKERIRAQSMQTVEASRAQAEQARAQKEFDISVQNGNFKLQELQLQKELALLQYANAQKISLDTVKSQLAKSAMDNQTKKELAAAEIQLAATEGDKQRAHDLHKHTNPSPSLIRDQMQTPVTP